MDKCTKEKLYTKLLKVTTKSGRTIEATSGMSFLTRKGIKLIETLGSDLIVGDKIPVLSDIKDNPEMIINYIIQMKKILQYYMYYKK